MNNITKIGATAAAIGALGIAGGFGTFSAFTANGSDTTGQFKTGGVSVTNAFALPSNVADLGTTDSSNPGEYAALPAGSILVKNTGTLPENIFIQMEGDGSAASKDLTDALYGNLEVTNSYDADFANKMDDRTRLAVLNNRPLAPLPDLAASAAAGHLVPLVLNPGDTKTVYYRVDLRSRGSEVLDNVNQLKAATETVHVKAIEAGRNFG